MDQMTSELRAQNFGLAAAGAGNHFSFTFASHHSPSAIVPSCFIIFYPSNEALPYYILQSANLVVLPEKGGLISLPVAIKGKARNNHHERQRRRQI